MTGSWHTKLLRGRHRDLNSHYRQKRLAKPCAIYANQMNKQLVDRIQNDCILPKCGNIKKIQNTCCFNIQKIQNINQINNCVSQKPNITYDKM